MENMKKYITQVICYFWINPLRLAFLMSASLLGGAYAFQYIGGVEPCDLCWTQRYIHMAILGLSAVGLLFKSPTCILRYIYTGFTTIALYISSYAAGYHAGVEQKWWQGPTTCTSSGLNGGASMDDLFESMMSAKLVLCDEIAWDMFGISMAGYNFLFSFGTALFVTLAMIDHFRKKT